MIGGRWKACWCSVRRGNSEPAVRFYSTIYSTVLLHRDAVVLALPAILLRPIEREHDLAPSGQRGRREIERVDAEAGVARVGVVRTLPAVNTPMHQCGSEQHKAQLLIAGQGAGLVVKP